MCRDGEKPLPDDEYVIDGWCGDGITATVTADGTVVEYMEDSGIVRVTISIDEGAGSDGVPDETEEGETE